MENEIRKLPKESRPIRALNVEIAEREKRLPTLSEAANFLKDQNFDFEEVFYEGPIDYNLTTEDFNALDDFTYEIIIVGFTDLDGKKKARLRTGLAYSADSPRSIQPENYSSEEHYGVGVYENDKSREPVYLMYDYTLHNHPPFFNIYDPKPSYSDFIWASNAHNNFITTKDKITKYTTVTANLSALEPIVEHWEKTRRKRVIVDVRAVYNEMLNAFPQGRDTKVIEALRRMDNNDDWRLAREKLEETYSMMAISDDSPVTLYEYLGAKVEIQDKVDISKSMIIEPSL
jgi:hypothetical protein